MKIEEFQQQSVRTCPFNAAPENIQEFNNLLGNYAMGLVGEHFEHQQALSQIGEQVGPNDIQNVFKEIGDQMHYAVNLLTLMDEDFDERKLTSVVLSEDIEKAFGDVLEIPKKYIYHGHTLDREGFTAAVYMVISKLYEFHRSSMPEILQMNIDKLKKRYPEKFTVEDSIARVDEK